MQQQTSAFCFLTKEELDRPYTPDQLPTINLQRRTTCAFLQEAGIKLNLPQLTIATAISFFHKFFASHTFMEYDRFVIAATCMFLAGKVEESPKKLRDVITVTYGMHHKDKVIAVESPDFMRWHEQILTHELIVLESVAFEMNIEHPYKPLLHYVRSLGITNKELAQCAWNFVNDSLRTTLCLQYKPELIASAAIFLASKFLKEPLPEDKTPWWQVVDASIKDMEEISGQILDLYDSSKATDSNGKVESASTTDQSRPPLTSETATVSTVTASHTEDSNHTSRTHSIATHTVVSGDSNGQHSVVHVKEEIFAEVKVEDRELEDGEISKEQKEHEATKEMDTK